MMSSSSIKGETFCRPVHFLTGCWWSFLCESRSSRLFPFVFFLFFSIRHSCRPLVLSLSYFSFFFLGRFFLSPAAALLLQVCAWQKTRGERSVGPPDHRSGWMPGPKYLAKPFFCAMCALSSRSLASTISWPTFAVVGRRQNNYTCVE